VGKSNEPLAFEEVAQYLSQVPYPLISLVTRLPQTLQGQCPLSFHSRTFETFSLAFNKESEASDVFDSVKELTVASMLKELVDGATTEQHP
jgi:hypothetical protein